VTVPGQNLFDGAVDPGKGVVENCSAVRRQAGPVGSAISIQAVQSTTPGKLIGTVLMVCARNVDREKWIFFSYVVRGWEAVQQEDRWCASHAGFSIENLELVNVCCAVSNLGPGDRPILLSLHKKSLAHGCFPLLPA
jgi:hypothetical protein